jgi:dipeptidyl aminopeptidase/acylaminoacyl peptidase
LIPLATIGAAGAQDAYRLPPPELQALVDAPRPAALSLGPRRDVALLIERPGLPGIAEIAQPELKLAGLRINARMRAASRYEFGRALALLDLASGTTRPLDGLPPEPRIADIAWSPDGRRVAFSRWAESGVELWLLDVAQARVHRLLDAHLLAVVDRGFAWLGNAALLATLPPAHQAPAPVRPATPAGPAIQESIGGKVARTTTFADMLRSSFDEQLLEWHLQGEIAQIGVDGSVTAGTLTRFGGTGAWLDIESSPDAQFVLTTEVHRPFSYLVPVSRFPARVRVIDLQGRVVREVVDLPLLERLAPGNDAVPPGPRGIRWRADAAATLVWAEAQDGGDPAQPAPMRDAIVALAAPFDAPPSRLAALAWRVVDVAWGNDDLALVTESWWKTRDIRTWRIRPSKPDAAPEELFARKSEDRYADPGDPSMRISSSGRRVLNLSPDGQIFLLGAGASPEGDRPFIDRFDLQTHASTRLWQSAAPFFEQPIVLLDDCGAAALTRREAVDTPPNYFRRSIAPDVAPLALTHFPHPTPQLRDVKKQLLRYRRADGIELSATLYLPPGYEPERDGPRPTLLWAYPREFKTDAAASQVQDSPYRFNQVSYWGPLALLARGYVVLDDPAMPIVGTGDREPNDSYVAQLTMDAQAAVDAVVARGVADRDRLAVGGHSYGAFMTANLLAHTRLFRAGIARSGAYNRTLTPFGFQSEERNYWRARATYQQMSPFDSADRIEAPLLLIHGAVDSNSGTFPIQSERLYQAIQGLAGNVRWVVLPEESHHYAARESILHMLWEEDQWLARWLGPGAKVA